MLFKYTFVLLCAVLSAHGARILGIWDFPSKSHHILGSALLKALAERGHQVTMLSPFPLKTPVKNYEDIALKGVEKYKDENIVTNIVKTLNKPFILTLKDMQEQVKTLQQMVLNQTFEEVLKPDRKFDLIIQNWFFNEAYLGIADYFNVPVIAFSGGGSSFLTNALSGNTNPYSYVPNILLGYPGEMTFLQRVVNTLSSLVMNVIQMVIIDPNHEYIFQKYFPNAPPIHQLKQNVSLVLLNSHVSIESPRPYVPSTVQIGGFHVQEPKELTGELKKFMDGAKEGVLYFSLGSNVRSADLPEEKLEAIVKTFSKLPVKVLWKFESDDLPNLPPNIKIGKWFPQGDILAHPNLKLFVTHGGLLSTTEAVYHGVPVVGIPLFADQKNNIAGSVNKGFAVQLSYYDLNEETFTNAIDEILNNPSYTAKAKELSSILKDQPLKPIDNAVFWVEYVLRHNGAHHLKTSALKLAWYQYFLLDVIAFLLSIALVIILVSYFVLKMLWKALKKLLFKKDKKAPPKKPKSSKKSKVA